MLTGSPSGVAPIGALVAGKNAHVASAIHETWSMYGRFSPSTMIRRDR
jgi:hypothetical protein